MSISTTITIRVSRDMKEKLERLARDTRRSKSHLAAEAVSAYVEREFEIIDDVERARRDVAAGRVVDHDDAMAEIEAAIRSVRADRD